MVQTKEERNAASRKWVKKNREKRKKILKSYQERNKERIAVYHKAYAERNKERIAVYRRKWQKKNREKLSERARERRRAIGLKGYSSWNKGKTKETDSRIKKQAELQKKIWSTRKHPFQGKHHSEESKQKNRLAHLGKKISEETRKKMIVSTWTGHRKGKHHSEESKQKNRLAHLGKHHSEATRKKMSNSRKGRKLSEETKRKLSIAKKGRKFSLEHRKKLSEIKNTPEAKKLSREIRSKIVFPKKDSKPEKDLHNILKSNKIKFEKHKAIRGQPDVFIKPDILIFADGDYWHFNPKPHTVKGNKRPGYNPNHKGTGKKIAKDVWAYDKEITRELKKNGYRVLRFWESQLENNPEKCLKKILKAIKA